MTTVFTIGHGNRPLDEFMALLRQARIERLVDVRAFPASRRHPQFARAALMCAERLPWRCHRFLISDSLIARDIEVMHIVSEGEMRQHTFSQFARIDGGLLIYDVGMPADLAFQSRS